MLIYIIHRHVYVYILCVCIRTYTYTKVLIDILTCPELQVFIRPSSLKFGKKNALIKKKKKTNKLTRFLRYGIYIFVKFRMSWSINMCHLKKSRVVNIYSKIYFREDLTKVHRNVSPCAPKHTHTHTWAYTHTLLLTRAW